MRCYSQDWPAPRSADEQLELCRRYRFWIARSRTVRRVIRRMERDADLNFWELRALEACRDVYRRRAEEPRNTLWATTMRLVSGYAAKYAGEHLTSEELEAIGSDFVLRAIEHFDPDRGVRFVTYCSWAVTRGMGRAVQDARRRAQREVELPEVVELGSWSPDQYEEPDWDSRNVQEVSRALASIPAREREVVLARCNGETLTALARRRGVCRERIRQIEQRAVRRVGDVLGVKIRKPLSLASVR